MDKEINKPVILLREEFRNNLVSLINSIEFAKEIELGQELHKRGKCTSNSTSIGT